MSVILATSILSVNYFLGAFEAVRSRGRAGPDVEYGQVNRFFARLAE